MAEKPKTALRRSVNLGGCSGSHCSLRGIAIKNRSRVPPFASIGRSPESLAAGAYGPATGFLGSASEGVQRVEDALEDGAGSEGGGGNE